MTDYIEGLRERRGLGHTLIGNSRHLALMLCQERINQGYGQSDVADAAGTTQSVVSDIERGKKSTMNMDTALRIAAALGFRLALVPFTAEDEEAVQEILDLESVVVQHDEENDRWCFLCPNDCDDCSGHASTCECPTHGGEDADH